jgi:hypothetical protein
MNLIISLNTKEKFGGKNIYFANERGLLFIDF